jgi:hypothetical protein
MLPEKVTAARTIVCLAAALAFGGCTSRSSSVAVAPPAPEFDALEIASSSAQAADRLLIRQVSLRMDADNPESLAEPVNQIAVAAGGFVQRVTTERNERLEVMLRVPAARLDTVLAQLERLGDVKERAESARDVTEESIDVEARLTSLIAVRDRLRSLLRSSNSVQDIIAVERELARIQGEVDALEARLKYLRSNVALAQVAVRIDQRHILGPLGWVVAGAAWVVSKLFVIK